MSTASRSPVASRPPKPRPRISAWIAAAAVIAITVWAGVGMGFDLRPLFTDLDRGWFIIRRFLSPNWSFIPATLGPWFETLSIAVIASIVGCGVALVLAMLTSTVTSRSRAVSQITKAVLSVVRSLPDVGWGLLFVAFVGVGSLAGILALVMFNIGIAAKLTGETIDAVDRGPLEAADAAGANIVQRATSTVVPQILPNYYSYSLYVFELNMRASIVLGFVGAGGIGSRINVELSRFNYENVSAIIVMIFAVVFVLDAVSRELRKRLV